ncbi:hypothetical protein CSKR_107231, partial [Clonorchis sinensis]
MSQRLEREFTDHKVRGSNPTSASRLFLSRLEQPDSIQALVLPSVGMAARHRKGVTAERFIYFFTTHVAENSSAAHNRFCRSGGSSGESYTMSVSRKPTGTSGLVHETQAVPSRVKQIEPRKLLTRLLKILRQPTTNFALLGAHQ